MRTAVKCPADMITRLSGTNKNKCAQAGVFTGG